jgi:hypothetical protein
MSDTEITHKSHQPEGRRDDAGGLAKNITVFMKRDTK